MNTVESSIRSAVNGVDFSDIESQFNENIGAFIAQVRHMNQLRAPEVMSLLSVSKKTYLEMEKGKRQYRMHLIAWWCFVMGLSPLHILAQSDYFAHLPIGDYRNIRQIKLALLLQRVSSDECLDTLADLIDDCPRVIQRDAETSLSVDASELEDVRDFFFSDDYYKMIAGAMRQFMADNHLTRREFARFLNVTTRTVRRILNAEVALNYNYYARFYLSTGVYPMKVIEHPQYLKIRLKLEQRFFLINDLIAGYGSSPERLDTCLLKLNERELDAGWRALFRDNQTRSGMGE